VYELMGIIIMVLMLRTHNTMATNLSYFPA